MKCSACGAENDSKQINCIFCGESLINSTTRIETDLINADDKHSFFVKKFINGEGKEVIESNEIGLKLVEVKNGRYFLYFISLSLIDKSELFLNLYAWVSTKSFTWDGECQTLELKIKFSESETINFNVNYTSYKEDNQLASWEYGNHSRVYFRVPFTKELFLKMIESKKCVFSIKARTEFIEKISLSSEIIIPFCGFYNYVYNTSIRLDDVNKFWSDKMKLNLIKKKGLFLAIEKNIDLKKASEQLDYIQFKDWINSNKEKINSIIKNDERERASENQIRENNIKELELQKTLLRKRNDNSGLRFLMNIFLSLVLFIFLWIKIDFKTSFIVIALYNIIFTVWSKNKTKTLEKSIKELEEKVK